MLKGFVPICYHRSLKGQGLETEISREFFFQNHASLNKQVYLLDDGLFTDHWKIRLALPTIIEEVPSGGFFCSLTRSIVVVNYCIEG